jgi:hypothetical protein
MSTQRKPLSSILPGGDDGNDDIFDEFDRTKAAEDFGTLPKGAYIALAIGGQIDQAGTGTKCYTMEFRISEGEFTGRRLWLSRYFTPAALPYTKRDLAKFGIDSKVKLDQPFPANRFVCRLTVVLRREDDGTERNEIRNVEVLRVQEPQADPFAPPDTSSDGSGETGFPFGANRGAMS